MTRYALAIAALVLLAPVGASGGAVNVSWYDAVLGVQTVDLEWAVNPHYHPGDPGGPGTLEPMYVWQGEVHATMRNLSSMLFVVSGNFKSGEGIYEEIWTKVRINQYVMNETNYQWTGFYLDLANLDGTDGRPPDPNPARNPSFYKVDQWEPSLWDPFMESSTHLTYDSPDPEAEPWVNPHSAFHDVAWVDSDVDWASGDGGFLLYKNAVGEEFVAVPEPGSMVTVLGCLAGFLGYLRRRKA